HLVDFFAGIDWWRLRPAPVAVVNNPGAQSPAKYIAAAKSDERDLMVVYVPEDRTVEIRLDAMPTSPEVTWISPSTGKKSTMVGVVTANSCQFPTPSEGDWILFMKMENKESPKEETAKD